MNGKFFDGLFSLLNKSMLNDLTSKGLFGKVNYLLLDFHLLILQGDLMFSESLELLEPLIFNPPHYLSHYIFLVEITSWYLFGSELCQNTWHSLAYRKSFIVKTLVGFVTITFFFIIIFKKRASRPFVRFMLNFSQK